jgi:DNA-binding transcriptional MerR regulator
MRIQAVARRLGVGPDWLRRLERTGRMPPVQRDLNGHRRFSERDVRRLRDILFGRGNATIAK